MKNKANNLTCETDYFSTSHVDDILVFRYKGNSLLASTLLKVKETVLDFFKQAEAHPGVRIVVVMSGPKKPRREEYLSFFDMVASSRLSETSVMRLYRAVDQLIQCFLTSDLFFISAHCGKILPMFIAVSMACDYRILGENTVIQNPSLHVGLAPKGGAPFFLNRTLGKGRIYDLMLSSQDISVSDAMELGLADRCVSIESFEDEVIKIAAKFAALPSSSLRLAKRLVNYPVEGIGSYLEFENKQLLSAMIQKIAGSPAN